MCIYEYVCMYEIIYIYIYIYISCMSMYIAVSIQVRIDSQHHVLRVYECVCM